jgi:Na+-driven multidrug efflux pump|tara:strand:- start:354 stop:605 length:252 start_codon:yes stop_codon:yes gene_type:complete
MAEIAKSYPMSLSVDYPERLNRLTTFFRIIMVIPIFIVISLIASGFASTSGDGGQSGWGSQVFAGIVFLPLVLMILFRKKYPR